MLQISNLHANVGDKPILKGFSLVLAVAVTTLAASAQANEPVEHPAIESTVATGSITIPDEFAPAVVPYFDCLNKAINDGVGKTGRGADADQVRMIETQALLSCRATRETAATKADKLLRAYDKKMPSADRTAKIETKLVGIEAMFTGVGDMMDKINAAPTEVEKTNAPNN
ncbi:MAG: hypothetical protein ABL928_16405 [Sphingorhabdus sp.]